MHCNIDSKGKAMRLAIGVVLALLGVGLILLGRFAFFSGKWPIFAGLGLLAVGSFAIFEGWAGWCAVRALGFRTRI